MLEFVETDQKISAPPLNISPLSTGSAEFLEMTATMLCLEGRFFQVAECTFLNTQEPQWGESESESPLGEPSWALP